MVRLHDSATEYQDAERIAAVLAGVRNPETADAFIQALARRENLLGEPLTATILEVLSKLPTPPAAVTVLQKLDQAQPGQDLTQIVRTISSIETPEAREPLENAAQGKKEIGRNITRAAATLALRHYPGPRTQTLLEQLSQDPDRLVGLAAGEALASLKRARSLH